MTTTQPTKPKRRWHQFSLRSLLIAMFVLTVAFGSWLFVMRQNAQANRERMFAVEQTVAAIEALSEDVRGMHTKRRPQTWLEKLFDDPGNADDPVRIVTITKGRFKRDTTAEDARRSSVKFNLHTLRGQIQHYKAQHGGLLPSADLSELLKGTNADGTDGTKFGPYLQAIPVNSLTDRNDVLPIDTAAVYGVDLTQGGGGWIYSTTSGNIWIDHPEHWTE